ncbi:tRNA (5-methylaminomethyl-2-thiouridine)(34)-methyltransferase MnmD [Amylibacter sp. SFDW26]|uniref:tRNA (5-methylaminomethyl-2-thiouridine)(34)-methyltransferase MnmD n=1 Tax=Amylibacter sp. SFDW26 TaxID=2652722 RepID=UPI0012620CE9|nr:tRNA (5-methylaminomethyl-2-thiouridine)(34)-methyltransferase MnmD [Amylibacter sp. SFDW26]KAB7614341.1 tRNA (5-methylaminomethyl-2-thiouridine)(34)-methyltransferase MnmD [Amylibacter sp. SFDW26]
MSDQSKTAKLEWRDGVIPIATQFDDPYFSLDDGLAETEFVFLGGNDLPARFVDGFHIAELGFGTGLNLLAAWRAWVQSEQKGRLHYTSFEAYPMDIAAMAKATSVWPELCGYSKDMIAHLMNGSFQIETPNLSAKIIIGDARETVAKWDHKADAWFLDGFSPAKNPELWETGLMQTVADHTAPQGTFATYTAAGHVRQSLASAGFTVTKVKGFGRKRHMTVGTL